MMVVIRFTLPLWFASLLPHCGLRHLCRIPRSLNPARRANLRNPSPLCRMLPQRPGLVTRSRAHASAGTTPAGQPVDQAWPRKATRGDETFSMYQPQLEAWKGDEFTPNAALAVMSTANKTTRYGVVWFTAQTEVDKVNRQVTLDNFQITRVSFPMMKAKEADYQAFLQAKLPGKSKVIALDRLEAALAASDSEQAGVEALPVNNDPPKVIFSTKPSCSSLSMAHQSTEMSGELTCR